MRRTAALISVAFLVACGREGAPPELLEGLPIDALAETVWVEEFDISPDGSLIAYKSAAEGTYDIWVIPTAGGEPRRLTDLPGREMAPKFSPDGRWIAFEADYGGTDVRDVWIVPAEGGDAVNLTDHPLNDANVSWSPDSRRVYFDTGRFWDASVAEVDVATGAVTRVGPGRSGDLSPDGRWFAFTGNSLPNDDDQSNSDIYVVPATGGERRLLTASTVGFRDVEPKWSPDGSKLAFISDRNGWNNLGVIDVATGAQTMLLVEDTEHSEPRWSPDGRWITFTKNLDYQYHIFRISADGGEAVQVTRQAGVNGGSRATGQTRGMHLWHPDGQRLVYHHSSPASTGDLWVTSAFAQDGGAGATAGSGEGGAVTAPSERRVTNHQHPALEDGTRFVWPEFMEYTSFDGLSVAGLVYKPQGTQPGDRLPALFFFRANSNGQHPVQWHPYIQYFVSRGYVVFAPNFRMSTGRGRSYRQAGFTHGGDHDIQDAFIGMDLLVEQGWVDPDRVGAFGGSTGGFYTTAAITREPERFKAGVVWYGSTDNVTLSSYGSMEGWNKFMIGRTPLENARSYYDRSIIYHLDRVDVPLLFLYAQGDAAARFQQIELYGVQADVRGRWWDWVVYGGEPHGWYHWRPDSVRQSLELMSDMFDRWVAGRPHDVKARAEAQRDGVVFSRNPNVDLWNALVHGRP